MKTMRITTIVTILLLLFIIFGPFLDEQRAVFATYLLVVSTCLFVFAGFLHIEQVIFGGKDEEKSGEGDG